MSNSHSQYAVHAYPSIERCIKAIADKLGLQEFTVTDHLTKTARETGENYETLVHQHYDIAVWFP